MCSFPPCLGDCNKGSLQFLCFSLCTHKTWEQMFSTWWGNWTTKGRSGKRHFSLHKPFLGLPTWLRGEEPALQCMRHGFDPWVRKIPRRRKWQSTPVLLPGKPHGQRSLVGYRPWGHKRVGHNLATKQPQQIFASFWIFFVPCTMGSTLKILKNLILKENKSQKKIFFSKFPKLCLKGSNHSYKVTKT